MAFLDNPLLSMGNFLGQAGQGINSAMSQASNPFGLAPPPGQTPEMAQRMPYLDLGTRMLANSDQRPMQALGGAFRDMQQQGMENSTKRLWAQQVQSQLQDADEERKSRQQQMGQLRQLLADGGQAGPDGQMTFTPQQRFQAQYWLGAGDPTKAASALFKEGDKPGFQTREVNGRIYSFDPSTGTLGQDLGAASTRQQTVPSSVQSDVIRAKQAYATLDKELQDYEALVSKTGYTFVPGKETDQVAQKRRNIQLQLKELYNLGVLNGPDLSLMDQMLYDPSALSPSNWGNMIGGLVGMGDSPASRAKSSSGNLRQMMRTIVDNKISSANSAGGSFAPMPSDQAPDGVEQDVWDNMSLEDRALWQQN